VRPALHGLDRERWVFRDVPVGIDDVHNSLLSAGSMVLYAACTTVGVIASKTPAK
jgi:hypothetical protein